MAVVAAGWVGGCSPGDYVACKFPPLPRHSRELADWLTNEDMDHVRGATRHPQTQGKIERWHQTLKNRILIENYYPPELWNRR